MHTIKRAIVYFDSKIHNALKYKAAETSRTISDLVNEAVKLVLTEDAEDLAAFSQREHERVVTFEDVLAELKKDGRI